MAAFVASIPDSGLSGIGPADAFQPVAIGFYVKPCATVSWKIPRHAFGGSDHFDRSSARIASLVSALIGAVVAVGMTIGGAANTLFGVSFWSLTAAVSVIALVVLIVSSLRSTVHVIRDVPKKGDVRRHIAKWEMKNYDQRLPQGIRFAQHVLSIDETRADFPRVKWGWKGAIDPKAEGEPERFIQLWIAGNHSDIGGSYAEEQSRLSDTLLGWMLDEAASLPHPLIIDRSRFNVFPSPAGIQHCEVDAMRDTIARWLPRWLRGRWQPSWAVKPRREVLGAPMHASVADRFALAGVWKCGSFGPYRPETLRADQRFSQFYGPGGDQGQLN